MINSIARRSGVGRSLYRSPVDRAPRPGSSNHSPDDLGGFPYRACRTCRGRRRYRTFAWGMGPSRTLVRAGGRGGMKHWSFRARGWSRRLDSTFRFPGAANSWLANLGSRPLCHDPCLLPRIYGIRDVPTFSSPCPASRHPGDGRMFRGGYGRCPLGHQKGQIHDTANL